MSTETAAAARAYIDANEASLHGLLADLVRARSVLGEEEPAQRVVERRLRDYGFAVERVVPDVTDDPGAGYPPLPYDGRSCVAGRLRGDGGGRSLHLSGHVDVVPVDAAEPWTQDPFEPTIRDGRMYGRGAGDMKGGIAAYLFAVEAVLAAHGTLAGDLVFSSVIEEECTGNGMRAVLQAGYTGDATLIGEPTDLDFLRGGAGVIWTRVRAAGASGHARTAATGAADRIAEAIVALRRLEARLNEAVAGDARYGEHPFRVNLGQIDGGVWPSSSPARIDLRVRVGFGEPWTPADAQDAVRRALAHIDGVECTFDGFRAHPYRLGLGNAFVGVLAESREAVDGVRPRPLMSRGTTDLRYVPEPATCFGPRSGNNHGPDEWVDLTTVKRTAETVALAAIRWCAEAPLDGQPYEDGPDRWM